MSEIVKRSVYTLNIDGIKRKYQVNWSIKDTIFRKKNMNSKMISKNDFTFQKKIRIKISNLILWINICERVDVNYFYIWNS